MDDLLNSKARSWLIAACIVFGGWALVELLTMNSARNFSGEKVIELYARSGGDNGALAANVYLEGRKGQRAQTRLTIALAGLAASGIALYLASRS